MHNHITECDSESCELPRFDGINSIVAIPGETVSEAQHVAEVAIKALDSVVELHRQEEETERTNKIVEGAIETNRIRAEAEANAPDDNKDDDQTESAEEEVGPSEEESEEAAEEIEPPSGETTSEQPPEQEEKHAEDKEESKTETRRRKAFGRR